MSMTRHIIHVVAISLGILASVPVARAECVLKATPMKEARDCVVAIGFADGKKVGAFRTLGAKVGLTAACTSLSGFHKEIGKLIPPNKIVFNSTTYTLNSTCMNSMKN
jgi:hypothetical protein